MDRRDLLRSAAAGTALVTLPGWLAGCFQSLVGNGNRVPDLLGALHRAGALGKPLLVLVIPAKEESRNARGKVFGGLLNHGGDEVLADLALCEVACGTTEDAEKGLHHVAAGEPLMLLVETQTTGREVTAVDPSLPPDPEGSVHEHRKELEPLARERIRIVAQALHSALLPDAAALERRAAEAEGRVGPLAGPDLRSIDRGAAMYLRNAERHPETRAASIRILADAARDRMVKAPVPGAKWATSSGCGMEVEGERASMVDCGMGFVPEVSQRFLWFFTGGDR